MDMKKNQNDAWQLEQGPVWMWEDGVPRPSPFILKWWQDASILIYGDSSRWLDVGVEFGYMIKEVDPETKEISYIPEGFDYRLTYRKSFGIPDNMPIISAQRDAEHFEHLWNRLLKEHDDV
jgi:hypothetical protein